MVNIVRRPKDNWLKYSSDFHEAVDEDDKRVLSGQLPYSDSLRCRMFPEIPRDFSGPLDIPAAGAFGQVFKFKSHFTSRTDSFIPFAMKQMHRNPLRATASEVQSRLNAQSLEIRVLQRLGKHHKCPNLPQYFGYYNRACEDARDLVALDDKLRVEKFRTIVMSWHETTPNSVMLSCMTPKRLRNFMKGLLNGLAYLHAEGIIHRDIKLSNILFDWKRSVPVIIDFGLAQVAQTDIQSWPRSHFPIEGVVPPKPPQEVVSIYGVGHKPGTPGYRAPEILLGYPTTDRVDIWSAGITMMALLTGNRHPFFLCGEARNFNAKLDNERVKYEERGMVTARRMRSTLYELAAIKYHLGPRVIREAERISDAWFRIDTPLRLAKNHPRNKAPDKTLFDEPNFTSFKKQIRRSRPGMSSLPDSAFDLLSSLLQANPLRRPSAYDLLKHPFFKEDLDESETLACRALDKAVEQLQRKQQKSKNECLPVSPTNVETSKAAQDTHTQEQNNKEPSVASPSKEKEDGSASHSRGLRIFRRLTRGAERACSPSAGGDIIYPDFFKEMEES